jgi:hypothetical protein
MIVAEAVAAAIPTQIGTTECGYFHAQNMRPPTTRAAMSRLSFTLTYIRIHVLTASEVVRQLPGPT